MATEGTGSWTNLPPYVHRRRLPNRRFALREGRVGQERAGAPHFVGVWRTGAVRRSPKKIDRRWSWHSIYAYHDHPVSPIGPYLTCYLSIFQLGRSYGIDLPDQPPEGGMRLCKRLSTA